MSVNRRYLFKLFAGAAYAATATGLIDAVLEGPGALVGTLNILPAKARVDIMGGPYEKTAIAQAEGFEYCFSVLYESNPDEDANALSVFRQTALKSFERCHARNTA